MKTVPGGWSQLTRDLLRALFVGRHGLADAGVELTLDRRRIVVKVEYKTTVADEEALNAMFFTTGASGQCPCGLLCSVVNKQRTEDVAAGIPSLTDIDPSLQDISCPDVSLCTPRTDEDVWAICDHLEQLHRKEDIDEIQASSGIKRGLQSVLFCKELRPFVKPTSVTFDPMHILFSNGLLSTEVMSFLHFSRQHSGLYFAEVRHVFSTEQWKHCGHGASGKNCPAAFNAVREGNSHDTLKAGSSELLEAYPLLRYVIHMAYGSDAPEPEAASILKLMEVCDLVRKLLKCPPANVVNSLALRLKALSKEYLEIFVKAYGKQAVRFKHHQLIELPGMILKNMLMLNCWVLERKHLSAKEASQHTKLVKSLETTMLSRMLNAQVRQLQDPGWKTCLTGKITPAPELAAELGAVRVEIAENMSTRCVQFSCGDVAFMDINETYLIIIIMCMAIDDSFALMVRQCVNISGSAEKKTSTWRVQPENALYALRSSEYVMKAPFHRWLSADTIQVLH